MKIISIVGARPNFIKIAPFIHEIEKYNAINTNKIEHLLVHTGQHYDDRMSKAFFNALNIPTADINLGIGSGSHAEQVGCTMIAFEKILLKEKTDWIVVVGDVNATLACSITAKKYHIKVCHIEAGLRSGDEKMPEEINRIVTDRLSDLLLVPDKLSGENLKKEGVHENRITFVGNIMIDTLEVNMARSAKLNIYNIINNNLLEKQAHHYKALEEYALITMHRPSNVDTKKILQPLIEFFSNEITKDIHLIWPIHPRTQNRLKEFGLWGNLLNNDKIILLHPIGYNEMIKLNMKARFILTDSGGLQEESCVLGTPCLTLRWNTERPIILLENGGTSILVGNNIDRIRKEYNYIKNVKICPERPELWDGNTAKRCVNAIVDYGK